MDIIKFIEVFGAALAAVIVALGGYDLVKGWLHRRANKRKAESEADITEAEADAKEWELEEKRIALSHSNYERVSEQLSTALKVAAKKEEIIEEKTARIRELTDRADKSERLNNRLNAKIIALTEELGQERLLRQHFEEWHCERNICRDPDGRIPPNEKLKGLKYEPPKRSVK